MQNTTLCYIEKDDQYLMLHRVKKENDVNHDKWVGIGGHFEENESPEECAVREIFEETGLKVDRVGENALKYRGIVTFVSDIYEGEYMHLFTCKSFSGEPTDCSEGIPKWVKKSELKNLNQWEGDFIFLDLIEKNVPFFSLKLTYRGDFLTDAVLNGEIILHRG